MQDILPLDAYLQHLEESLSRPRLALAMGLPYGVFMALAFIAIAAWTDTLRRPHALPLLVGVGLAGGLAFGLLMASRLPSRLRRASEEVYRGTGRLATPLPDPALFTHRLPCSLRRGRLDVGGVLYVGRREALFQPHAGNLPKDRAAVVIAHGSPCEVALVPLRPNRLAAFLAPQLPPGVEIACGDRRYPLVVPEPETVRRMLVGMLGE